MENWPFFNDEMLNIRRSILFPVINHLKDLENELFLIDDLDTRRQLEGNIKSKNITQCISAYFELDTFKLFKEAGLEPKFNIAKVENEKSPDIKVTLDNDLKPIVECMVLSENYKNYTYKQVMENMKNFHLLCKLKQNSLEDTNFQSFHIRPCKKNETIVINNSLESQEIKYFQSDEEEKLYNKTISQGTLGKKDIDKIQEFFKNPQSVFYGKSINFECQKYPSNGHSLKIVSPRFKNPIKQFKESVLDRKKAQIKNHNHPRILAVTNWGMGSWLIEKSDYMQAFKKLINEKNNYISPEISGLLIMPTNFFPIASISFEPNELKELFNLSHFVESRENYYWSKDYWSKDYCWSKEKRYIFYIENPQARYIMPTCFKEKLAQVVKIID